MEYLWLAAVRDVAIIILAIESIVIGILIGILVWFTLKFTQAVRGHVDRLTGSAEEILGNVKETTQTAADTAKSASGSVTYVGDRTVRPMIEIYSAVSGARRFVDAFFSRRPTSPPDGGS